MNLCSSGGVVRTLSPEASGFPRGGATCQKLAPDVADEVRKGVLRRRCGEADSANDQTERVVLLGEDVLHGRAHLGAGAVLRVSVTGQAHPGWRLKWIIDRRAGRGASRGPGINRRYRPTRPSPVFFASTAGNCAPSRSR